MKTGPAFNKQSRDAYALLMVMILAGVSIIVFASAAKWTSSSILVTDRHNTYNRTSAAAEAATETVLAQMARDFFNQGVNSDLNVYRILVPKGTVQDNWADGYQFTDGAGGVNRSSVVSTGASVVTNLDSQFLGLYGLIYPFRVVSNAKPLNTPYVMKAAVQQDFQLATIPIFQFAIFYSMDLEINPGPAMTITGKVHGNADLYSSPGTSLEFVDDVAAVGKIYTNRHPNDPQASSGILPVYDDQHVPGVSSLTLPIGTNNSPSAVRAVLEVPPGSESASSPLGQQRYYNKADLIVKVTSSGTVTVTSGNWNNFVTDVSSDLGKMANRFVVKTNTFYDYRESKWTITTQIDVTALRAAMTDLTSLTYSLNGIAKFQLGHELNSIYVDDDRTSASKLTVVRVSNGQQLPPDGLTVATELPLYVKGHFNAPDTTAGSTNTSATKPASLVADAITVLSPSWSDSYSSSTSLGSRGAANDTVNAAFLSGIVPSTQVSGTKYYSGGVENFPRFLEDWSGDTLTYNGSMVVMFPSKSSTNFWINTGTYYNAPTRKWAFDVNFLDQRKLPPGTPQVRKLVRSQWSVVAAQ
jgi:hypothetical protein